MQITIHGRHMSVGEALNEHAETRLGQAVEKYFSSPESAEVVFQKEGVYFSVDIHVHISQRIRAHGHGHSKDAYGALDEAVEHIAKKLRRNKRRLRDHRLTRREEKTLQALHVVLRPHEDETEEDAGASNQAGQDTGEFPAIVAETKTEIERLSVSEAVMKMDLENLNALLFRNSGTDCLNMLHVRPDGHIGWIEPEDES